MWEKTCSLARHWNRKFPGKTKWPFQMRSEGGGRAWLLTLDAVRKTATAQSCRTAFRGLFQAGEVQLSKTLHCFTSLVCGDLLEHSTLAESQMNHVQNPGLYNPGLWALVVQESRPSFISDMLSLLQCCPLYNPGFPISWGQLDMLTLLCHTYTKKRRKTHTL